MDDVSPFNRLEIVALTLIGEAESLGVAGMQDTASVIENRKKYNLHMWGGNDERSICLQPEQFSCWQSGQDRDRIIAIGLSNPLYTPYVEALSIADRAISGTLPDGTNNAVGYYDGNVIPFWSRSKTPCHIAIYQTGTPRRYYDFAAMMNEEKVS